MSRDMRDLSPETYVLNPDTSSGISLITALDAVIRGQSRTFARMPGEMGRHVPTRVCRVCLRGSFVWEANRRQGPPR
jgi:hypothetical protein